MWCQGHVTPSNIKEIEIQGKNTVMKSWTWIFFECKKESSLWRIWSNFKNWQICWICMKIPSASVLGGKVKVKVEEKTKKNISYWSQFLKMLIYVRYLKQLITTNRKKVIFLNWSLTSFFFCSNLVIN